MLRSIRLKNFKSFSGSHRFDFPKNTNGIYLVTAENQLESRLGSNGSGKSTLFTDSIAFCLYGRTMRGARAKNISTWNSKGGVVVECDLQLRDKVITVKRGWKPNFLKIIDGDTERDITQSQLESYLGLSFQSFTQSMIWGQFNPMFLDLSSVEKLELFSSLLDLDIWIEKSQAASKKAVELKDILSELRGKRNNLEGRLDIIRAEVNRNKQLADSFEEEVDRKISQLNEDIDLLKDDYLETKKELKLILNRKNETQSDIKEIENKIEENLVLYKQLVDKVEKLSDELKELEFRLDNCKKELNRFHQIDDECPYCKQKVDESYVLDKRKELSDKVKVLSAEKKELVSNIKSIKTDIQKYENLMDEYEFELNENNRILNIINTKMDEKARVLEKIKNDILYKKKSIENESNRPNPYIDALNDLMTKSNDITNRLNEILSTIADADARLNCYTYWNKGFKQIRLYMIEELINVFEAQVNNNLIQLGLEDWKVSFDIERETTTGNVAKGFHVSVVNPRNEENIPIESWSGGEYQRLRIAVNIGLSQLVSERSNIIADKLIIDEPTTHLNQQGIIDLLEALSNISDRQIWIIDHRSLDWGGFNGGVKLVKDEDGSRIESMNF